MNQYRQYTDEEIAALRGGVQEAQRPASGPQVAQPSRASAPQPEAQPRKFDLGRVSTYGDAYTQYVPEGVRNAIGAVAAPVGSVWKFFDTPLSERTGLRVPDMPGPIDETLNFFNDEITRPTNYLAALGLASKLTKAPRIVRAAGFFLDGPSRSPSFVNRAVAQAVMMTGARAASEVAGKALDSMEIESTPVRMATQLAAGIAGGGLSLAATRSAAEQTLGRDIMGSGLNLKPHITDATRTGAQAVPRKGIGVAPGSTEDAARPVLSLTTSDELVARGKNTVDYINNSYMPALDKQVKSVTSALDSYAQQGYKLLGKVDEQDGIWTITGGKSKRPVNLIDALDFGVARYGADLDAKQVEGINRMRAVARAGRSTHAEMAGKDLREAALMENQEFFPRQTRGKADVEPDFSKRVLGLSYEPGREIPDALLAQEKGVRYENPLAALESYLERNLRDAANLHVQELLQHPDLSVSWTSRVNKELADLTQKVRGQIRSARDTLTGQEGRAGEVRRTSRSTPIASERVVAASDRVRRVGYEVSADDVREARNDTTAAIERALQAEREAEAAIAQAKALGRADDAMMRKMERTLEKARALRAEADGYLNGAERIEAGVQFSTERAPKAGPWDAPTRSSGRRIGRYEAADRPANVTPADATRAVADNLGAEDALAAARDESLTMDVASDNARIASAETLRQQYLRTTRAADRLYVMHDGLTEMAARLSERLDDAAVKAYALDTGTTGTRAEIAMARAQERAVTRQERALYGAQRDLRALEREEARAIRAAVSAGKRDAALEKAKAASEARLESLRERVKELQVRVEANKRAAQDVPTGREQLPRGQFPLLAGRDFDKADAEIIRKAFTRSLSADSQAGGALKRVADINRNWTPIRAMADMSAVLNQFGWMMYSHPVTFARNFKRAAQWTLLQPEKFAEYVADPANADALQHGVVAMGRKVSNSLHQSEFEVGSWVERVPVLRELADHFRVFSTLNRIDTYNGLVAAAERSPRAARILKSGLEGATDAAMALSDVDKDAVARAVNRLSGIATGIERGPSFFKGGRPGDLETTLLFAPGFLRSGFETLIAATVDGGIEGSLARQYIRNMVVGAQTMAATVAVMQGRDPSEVTNPFDVRAMQRGEFRLNPNFGTIRIGGQDISLYGRWDSLARMAVSSVDAPMRVVSTQSVKPLLEFLDNTVSSKGSPLAAFAEQLVTDGQTYNQNDTLSVQGVIENALPFTASGFLQDVLSGESAGPAALRTGVSFFGGKANPLTPFEQLDAAAQTITGKPYDQLTGAERDRVREAVPNIVARADRQTERRAEGGDPKAQARVEMQKIDDTRIANEQAAYDKVQSGEITLKQFNDAIKQYAFGAAREKRRVQSVLGVDYGLPKGAQAALSEYFETYRKAEIAPDIVDFNVQEQLSAELDRRIEAGEFGDPEAAKQAIAERTRPQHTPEVQAFFDARQRISDSGYYDVVDDVYAKFRPRIADLVGADLVTYGEFQVALSRAARGGDMQLAARLKAFENAINRGVEPMRKRMRIQNPQLERDLVMTGRVDNTSAFARSLAAREQQAVSTP